MSLDAAQIKQKALDLGFHKVGIVAIAPLADSGQAEHPSDRGLARWLARGYQADMDWMDNPKRQAIEQILPGIKSVISLALNYYSPEQRPEQRPEDSGEIRYGKIARYGWGRDYHRVFDKRLKALALWLKQQDATIGLRHYADTGPVQDKLWAERAGLGWIAKNSNLITREYGSWVFLGSVLTTLELEADRPPGQPHTQHCGSCRRCIDACPTGAIVEPFVVDANRCIAYHTIENRAETLPEPIATHLQGWVAGCDSCQDCCPWNDRFAQPTDVADFAPYPWQVAPLLTELAALTDDQWADRLPASALRRIRPEMWRRNAQANLDRANLDQANLEQET
jgi:epoxyqueuosine reductase